MPSALVSEIAHTKVGREGTKFPRQVVDNLLEYTSFNAFNLVFDTVLRVTSRVFVGDVICRDQRWYDEIAAYQTDVALIVVALLPFPDFVRPFVAPFVPFRRQLNHIHNSVRDLIFLIVGQLKARFAREMSTW
jgi:hypothetical protein